MKINLSKARIYQLDGVTHIVEETSDELVSNLHRDIEIEVLDNSVVIFTAEKVNWERFVHTWELGSQYNFPNITNNKDIFDKVKEEYIERVVKLRRKFNWKKLNFDKVTTYHTRVKEGRVEMKEGFLRKKTITSNYKIVTYLLNLTPKSELKENT